MIQYRRKYNSKYKQETRPWRDTFLSHSQSANNVHNWNTYDFKIDGVIFTSPSKEFKEVYNKLKMWEKLSDS